MGLFDEQIARKPNRYPWTQDFINAMWEGHWTANEFSFKSDVHDFKTILTPQECEIIVRTLSAIGQIEVAVKTFWARLGDNLRHPGFTDLGYVMANSEVIHGHAYEKLLTVLGIEEVFQKNLEVDVIQGRVAYLKKYLEKVYQDDRKQYVYALTLFTLFIENVSLFSQFYIIMWFGRFKNVLKDANQQVMYTRAEEDLHSKIGTKIINTIRLEQPYLFDSELSDKVIHEAHNAYSCEEKVLDWILGDYVGERISAKVIKSYIKYKINSSLNGIGYQSIFYIDKDDYRDFEWFVEESMGEFTTDFFHRKPTGYAKGNKSYTEEDLF